MADRTRRMKGGTRTAIELPTQSAHASESIGSPVEVSK